MSSAKRAFRIGLCQMAAGAEKAANLELARAAVGEAAKNGARVVVLPECFNSPYGVDFFASYAEEIPSKETQVTEKDHPTTKTLLQLAQEHSVFLVGGSFPERASDGSGNIFNTCIVANPEGRIVAKHRKMHLFDIDIPGGITFKESTSLSPGNHLTTFTTPWCEIGVGICYDMRFPELAQLLAAASCEMLIYPGAFNTTTGPMHWELLQRARAVDNQLWVATASPARAGDGYQAWGHSSLVDPWGNVVATCDENPAVVMGHVDLDEVTKMRAQVPCYAHKRHDCYDGPRWKAQGNRQLLAAERKDDA